MPKIKLSPLNLILIPIVMLDPSGEIAATVIAAVLHELGHLAVILICRIGVKEITVTPYGLEILTCRKYRSFIEEIAVNSAGCTVNFATYLLLSGKVGFAAYIASSSVILGALNVLPVLSLDGGETLRAIFELFFSFRVSEKLSRFISFLTILMLWCCAAYIFLFSGYNYSLFVMSVWLFGKIYCLK